MLNRLAISIASLLLCSRAVADQTDDYIKGQMQQHRIPGLVIEVLKNGKLAKSGAYGMANLELNVPINMDTVLEIGSVTKQFTAAGILMLEQEAKLSTDDPVTKYLKDAPADWEKIKIRHLLSHTSGLKSYTGEDGFALTRHLTQKQFIEQIAKLPREFEPGDSFKYCNTGFNLLGYVIENVSGENYWAFMKKRIFDPLKMKTTRDRTPSAVIANRASGYEQTNHVWINRDYDITDVFSAGAIASTVPDLAKWQLALNSEDLLTATTKEKMWTPAKLNSGKPTGYGFGWFIDTVDGHKNIGHGGSTSGFSATVQRFPDDDLIVVILTNTDEAIASTLGKKIAGFYW